MVISMNVTRRLEVAKSVGGYGTEHRRVGGEGRKGERGGRSLETALGHKSGTKLSPGPASRCNFKAR